MENCRNAGNIYGLGCLPVIFVHESVKRTGSEVSRAITMDEYREVVDAAINAGLKNIKTQESV